jgi:hypothetical protein
MDTVTVAVPVSVEYTLQLDDTAMLPHYGATDLGRRPDGRLMIRLSLEQLKEMAHTAAHFAGDQWVAFGTREAAYKAGAIRWAAAIRRKHGPSRSELELRKLKVY